MSANELKVDIINQISQLDEIRIFKEIQKLLDLKEFNPSLILETQQKSLELRLQRIELRLQERLIFQAWEDLLPSVSLDKKG